MIISVAILTQVTEKVARNYHLDILFVPRVTRLVCPRSRLTSVCLGSPGSSVCPRQPVTMEETSMQMKVKEAEMLKDDAILERAKKVGVKIGEKYLGH